MKKFCIATLAIIMVFALTACGRRKPATTQTVPATQAPATEPMLPTIDPTMGTNIPDPEVDTSMPDLTEPMNETGGTDSTGSANKGGK